MKLLIRSLICFLGLTIFTRLGAEENRSLIVSANATRDEQGDILLRFSVKNTTSESIRVFTALLPWKRSSSAIYIVRTQTGELKEGDKLSFGFPAAGETVIEPQQQVSGTVSLKSLFGGSITLLDAGGYLYWSYVFSHGDDSRKANELYGGVLLITKR